MSEEIKSTLALEMRHISKRFGGNIALSDVSLDVNIGEVHALMGENGAGKSTLIKILSGAYRPDDASEVRVAGKAVAPGDPLSARKAGVAVIYQELSLAPNLSAAQNVFLGREVSRCGMVERKRAETLCQPIFDRLGIEFSPSHRVGSLSLGEQQLVEIARALSGDVKVIVMDEPTTSLTMPESERLFRVIKDLKAAGIAVVYISHRMAEVYELADRVTVLRDGSYVGTIDRKEATPNRLVHMMVGRDMDGFYKKADSEDRSTGEVLLSVAGLGDGRLTRDCSFELRRGEIVGLAGLVGSGRTELARQIFGADRRLAGRVLLKGQPLTIRSPGDALNAGVAYLTEDRKKWGLFRDMSIQDNISLSVLQQDSGQGGLKNISKAGERTDRAISSLRIRCSGRQGSVGSLSGGNQQKVLLARLLETRPSVVMLDEPTRGVDVGAKSEIYEIIEAIAAGGAAILLISSELPEITGISDRILVMREGEIAGEVHRQAGSFDQEKIMSLATGGGRRQFDHSAESSLATAEQV